MRPETVLAVIQKTLDNKVTFIRPQASKSKHSDKKIKI